MPVNHRYASVRVNCAHDDKLTLGPAEKDMIFEYSPGCPLASSERLSQRFGLSQTEVSERT